MDAIVILSTSKFYCSLFIIIICKKREYESTCINILHMNIQEKPKRSQSKRRTLPRIPLTFIHTTVAFLLADIVHDTGRASPICLVTSPLGFKDKSKSVKQKNLLEIQLQKMRQSKYFWRKIYERKKNSC